MREETFIQRSRQRVWAILEKRRRDAQLRKRKRKPHGNGKGKERVDAPTADGADEAARMERLSEANSGSESDDLIVIPKGQHLLDKELRAGIEPYTQALCLRLAHAILITLPREIRDQIYSYVLESQGQRITVCDGKLPLRLRASPSHNTMQSHRSFWTSVTVPHYLDPRYVGAEMTKEMTEAYYRTALFYFDYHDLFLISKFLAINRFDRRVIPAQFVRNIEIVLDESFRCHCNMEAWAYYGLEPSNVTTPEETLRMCLEQLLTLNNPAGIRLIVHRNRSAISWSPKYPEVLQVISSLAGSFRESGHDVTVTLHSNFGFEWSVSIKEVSWPWPSATDEGVHD